MHYDSVMSKDFGSQPEVLISLVGRGGKEGSFDPNRSFVLQTTMDAHEILRTQAININVLEDQWNYFSFYNNGNSGSIRVYVTTTLATRLEVLLSKGL